jgi:ketosteroid isomerase-like protein
MSEQLNVQRVIEIYEAFGRGDIAYIIDQLADDVRWLAHFEPVVPWGGDYSGKANVPRFFANIASSVDVESFAPVERIAQGDTVVSMGTFGCRSKVTGKSTVNPWVFIWKFRDGKVASYEQFHGPGIADVFR